MPQEVTASWCLQNLQIITSVWVHYFNTSVDKSVSVLHRDRKTKWKQYEKDFVLRLLVNANLSW